jgi:Histidine phosphatase superfamily (branch 1)
MKLILRICACIWLALCAIGVTAEEPSSEPVHELGGATLISALRGGGFVLYFRHTSTDFGQNDDSMVSFDDCTKQRNLTDKGRDEARRIGAAVHGLRIPLGSVLASPFCRTVETAMLAFGKAEKSMDLRGWGASNTDPNRYAPLRKHLGAAPTPATNTVLVGHGNPFRAIAGPPHLMEGEAAVIRPLGGEKFEIVARIRVERWADLLKEADSTLRRDRLVGPPENPRRARSSTALAASR